MKRSGGLPRVPEKLTGCVLHTRLQDFTLAPY